MLASMPSKVAILRREVLGESVSYISLRFYAIALVVGLDNVRFLVLNAWEAICERSNQNI